MSISFDVPVETFASDPDVVSLASNGGTTGLPSTTDALEHLQQLSIVGSWHLFDDIDSITMSFMPDGTYLIAEGTEAYPGETGGPGIEYGTYTWDPLAGAIDVDVEIDTNGTWGLSDSEDGTFQRQGDSLTVHDPSVPDETLTFTLASDPENPLVGGWKLELVDGEDKTTVVMVFTGTHYSWAEIGPETSGGYTGAEFGSYLWDADTGAFSADPLIDHNGDWAFSGEGPGITAAADGGILSLVFSDSGQIILQGASHYDNGGDTGGDSGGDEVPDNWPPERPPADDPVEMTSEQLAKYRDALIALRDSLNTEEIMATHPILTAVSIDLDNDRDMDLLLTGGKDINRYKMPLVVYRNIDNLEFVREETEYVANFRGYAIDDFNRDGLDDIFFGDHGYDAEPFPGIQDQLFFQTAAGDLEEVTATHLPVDDTTFTHSACSLLLTPDGFPDIFQGVLGFPIMLANQGDGSFAEDETLIPDLDNFTFDENSEFVFRGISYAWCATLDVDSDSDEDLVLGSDSGPDAVDSHGDPIGTASVILFNDYGTLNYRGIDSHIPLLGEQFSPWEEREYGANVVIDMVAEDFNSDNCTDLAMLVTDYEASTVVEVLVNDCAGNFEQTYVIGGLGRDAFMLYDVNINDDGHPDLLAAYPTYGNVFGSSRFYVLEGNGDGTFAMREGAASDIVRIPVEIAAFWFEP